ncbi:hypothetical protein PG996_000963 [Apiospora saccharicola]|uniref:Uncharacterized protein n=1 Tax=Apiospora saccharicola TaxID=335842 RepID=A0ABR1WFF8_9PEZI
MASQYPHRQSSDVRGLRKPRATAALQASHKRTKGCPSPGAKRRTSPGPVNMLFFGFPGQEQPRSHHDKYLPNRPRQKTPKVEQVFRTSGCYTGPGSAIYQPMPY